MLCLSTRGQSPRVPLHQAIIEGIAPDGGLYLPEHIPQIDVSALMESKSYREAALQIIFYRRCFAGKIARHDRARIRFFDTVEKIIVIE